MKFGRMFNGISNTLFSRGCPHFLKRIVWKKYFWIHLGILLTFFVVCAYLADLKLLRLRLNIVSDTSCDTYQKKNSYRFLQQVLHRTIFGIWSEVQLKVLDFLSEIIWKKKHSTLNLHEIYDVFKSLLTFSEWPQGSTLLIS